MAVHRISNQRDAYKARQKQSKTNPYYPLAEHEVAKISAAQLKNPDAAAEPSKLTKKIGRLFRGAARVRAARQIETLSRGAVSEAVQLQASQTIIEEAIVLERLRISALQKEEPTVIVTNNYNFANLSDEELAALDALSQKAISEAATQQ